MDEKTALKRLDRREPDHLGLVPQARPGGPLYGGIQMYPAKLFRFVELIYCKVPEIHTDPLIVRAYLEADIEKTAIEAEEWENQNRKLIENGENNS